MQVKIKKLNDKAVIPTRAHENDAGLDLTCISFTDNAYTECLEYGTGIAIEIPEGYVGLIFPRSSICKTELTLSNSVGVIDSGYRGEIKFMFKRTTGTGIYQMGDRIGQLVIIPFPKVELVEVQELSDSARGEGGHGSTGK